VVNEPGCDQGRLIHQRGHIEPGTKVRPNPHVHPAGEALGPIVVHVKDVFGALVTGSTVSATLAKATGTGNLTGVYLVSGGTSWISTSDRRLKENIGEARYGLGTVMRIPVREYNLKGSHEKKIGFVAQELYPIVPEIVSKGDDGEFTASSSPWGIDYAGLTPILVKSIQEQQQQIEKLVERLTELEARLRHAESRKPNQE